MITVEIFLSANNLLQADVQKRRSSTFDLAWRQESREALKLKPGKSQPP